MAELKLGLSDGPKLGESVKLTEEKVEVKFKEKMPSNWTLTDIGKGRIRGTSRLGDVFEGTTREFNKKLRG